MSEREGYSGSSRHLIESSLRMIEHYGELVEKQLQLTKEMLRWYADRLEMMERRKGAVLQSRASTSRGNV
jgi:hypothetical protein